MPTNTIIPREFWNEKLIGWEEDRYSSGAQGRGFLENLARQFSGLPERMATAQRVLMPRVAGKRIIEVGCGTGALAESLIEAGAESYLGFDIADSAVSSAQERVNKAGLSEKIEFRQGGVADIVDVEADIVFSMGLLDWLTHSEIESVFALVEGAEYLHSFSEKSLSIWRLIHIVYVFIAYGHKTGKYKPAYHTLAELSEIALRHNTKPIVPIRKAGMRFGCFMTSLDM